MTDWEGYTLRITTTITLSHPDSAIRAVERTQRAKGDTHKHIRLTVIWPQQQLQALGLAVVSHPQAPTSPVTHRHVPSRQQLHGAGVHAARSVRVSPGSGNDARRGAGEGAPLHVSATQGRATDQGGPTQGGEEEHRGMNKAMKQSSMNKLTQRAPRVQWPGHTVSVSSL